MGLKQIFEISIFKKKIKAKDILLYIEDGAPVFRALVCGALRNKDRECEYSEKDSDKIRELAEHTSEWWELELTKEACWLVYYPYKFWKKHFPDRLKEENQCFSLEWIAKSFTVQIGGKW